MREPYPYTRQSSFEYRFVSIGRRKIEKGATFDFNSEDNIFAFYFGDLKVDGTVDYEVRSNNGDIYEVLATIVSIIKEFLDEHPEITVFFTGNTPNRILYITEC